MTDESLTPERDAIWAKHDGLTPALAAEMLVFAGKMEQERDEWQLNALLKLAVKQLACMWCGEIVHAPTGYEPGMPLNAEQRAQAYREHVAACQKHPIRETERERDEIRERANTMFAKHVDILDQARNERDEARVLADRLARCLVISSWDHPKADECQSAYEAWEEARK